MRVRVACLPSSFLSLYPTTAPTAFIVALSSTLSPTPTTDSAPVLLNSRLATAYFFDDLPTPSSSPTSPSSDHALQPHPIAFLSPGLLATLEGALIAELVFDPPSFSSTSLVRVRCILPRKLPSAHAERAAAAAKRALHHCHVSVGDVIAVSSVLWLQVAAVHGSGYVTSSTDIALLLSPTSRPVSIPRPLREWACHIWRPRPTWDLQDAVTDLDAAIEARRGLFLLLASPPDADDVLLRVCMGRVVQRITAPDVKMAVEEMARVQVHGGVLVLEQVDEAAIEAVVNTIRAGDMEMAGNDGYCGGCCVVVCDIAEDVPEMLLAHTQYEVVIAPPMDDERERILQSTFKEGHGQDVEQRHVLQLVRMSTGFARRDIYNLGMLFGQSGISACREAVALFGMGQVSVDTGNVSWKDIGGLESAKQQICDLINLPSTNRAANESDTELTWNRRVGVLLHGAPGTGKTLLARAVANEFECSFLSVKGPELYDMYVGESEKNVRMVFERAKQAAPCVIFFDEIDALAPSRGSNSNTAGVGERIVSQLLAEFDDIVARNGIFVIAASNRPDMVDASLLRPGRLDRLVHVHLPRSRKEQATVLQAQTRKFKFKEDVDLEDVLSHAPKPPFLSGADLHALAAAAWKKAAKRQIASFGKHDVGVKEGEVDMTVEIGKAEKWAKEVESRYEVMSGNIVTKEGDHSLVRDVEVAEEDLVEAAKELNPSLSAGEVLRYEGAGEPR